MQAVHNIAEICAQHGITDVVLSPGSRSAPLTLAFARHPALTVRVVPDERAAAFIALGMAQAQRRAVVLVCTSGTAGLNYAPAVAEAYFQHIPLLILTADRPPEWIDQLDGQTIRQHNLYGAHAKGAFEFPADTSHTDAKWHSARIVNEAINLAQAGPAGPVQVNVPLREPFYPKAGEAIQYEQDVKIVRELPSRPQLPSSVLAEFRDALRTTSRVLVVAGQHPADNELLLTLRRFAAAWQVPVVGDLIANVHLPAASGYDQRLHPLGHQDVFMAVQEPGLKEALKPELLITFGQSLISKSLKLYLRNAKPAQHWHIQAAGAEADTFQSLTKLVRMEPADFFGALLTAEEPQAVSTNTGASKGLDPSSIPSVTTVAGGSVATITSPGHVAAQDATRVAINLAPIGTMRLEWPQHEQLTGADASYLKPWLAAENWATGFLQEFMQQPKQPFNEFTAFHHCLQLLPNHAALHLANSMAVRYANILGLPQGQQVEVFANRGTSGIDGCNSTAVGAALAQPERPVVLLTGDVAFFYDRNAFWHNYPTPNLRVVVFNNHGGGIFRIIDGPRQQPELDEFFETRQVLTAENTAQDFKLRYFPVSSFAELESALPVFFAHETGAALLEVTTDSKTNADFFEQYRAAVKAAFTS